MKREIKFRAKRIDNGWWVYGYFFETPLTTENFESNDGKDFFDSGLNRIRPCISDKSGVVYEIDPDTVGQFTGLPDRNGNQIYEDDIVDWNNELYLIVYDQEMAQFNHRPINPDGHDDYFEMENNQRQKVIGNIHENPELMEEAKQ